MYDRNEQLSIAELVLYLNMSIATIYRKIKSGVLPTSHRMGGNRVFQDKQEVDSCVSNLLKANKKGKENDLENE